MMMPSGMPNLWPIDKNNWENCVQQNVSVNQLLKLEQNKLQVMNSQCKEQEMKIKSIMNIIRNGKKFQQNEETKKIIIPKQNKKGIKFVVG